MTEQGEARGRIPLTEILDDLAGLAWDPEEHGKHAPLLEHLSKKYGDALAPTPATVRRWFADERPALPVVFLRAAEAATQGRLLPRIGEHLGRVRYRPDGTAQVGDLPALGAWAAAELVRSQELAMGQCPQCKRRFLTTLRSGSRACNRLHYDRRNEVWTRKTCRQLEHERLADVARRAYRREYRNAWDRVERKTLPREVFEQWKKEFSSLEVQPRTVDEWLELQLTARAKKAARLLEEHRAAQDAAAHTAVERKEE